MVALLGKGTHGSVFKDVLGSCTVAVKQVERCKEYGLPSTLMRELSILKSTVGCRHVVPLVDATITVDRVDIVMPFYDMDLAQFLRLRPVTPDTLRKLMRDLFEGLVDLHDRGIWHRDLKPQNILVNVEKDGEDAVDAAITDFGLGRTVSTGSMSPHITTRYYRAPEALLGSPRYTSSVDIWSLGCMFAEMASRTVLFRGQNTTHQLMMILCKMGNVWPGARALPRWRELVADRLTMVPATTTPLVVHGLCPDGHDLLARMLEVNPSKRISAAEALEHPYFGSSPMKPAIPRVATSDLKGPLPSLDTTRRKLVLEWLADIDRNFNGNPETFFLAVHILDRCGALTKETSSDTYKLAGLSSMLLASKMEEPMCMDIPLCLTLLHASTEDFIAMEECLFKDMGMNLVCIYRKHK